MGLIARRPWVVAEATSVVAFVAVTLLVGVDHAAAVRGLDDAVERWVVARQGTGGTTFFRASTHLGEPGVTFTLGVLVAAVAAFRSRVVALVIVVALLLRPLLSTVVKDLVGRPRPQLSQLVTAGGDAYPSGHASGAVLSWGVLVVTAYVWRASRAAVAALVVLAVLVVVVVAASRVYLGVHWLTDVLGGLLLGAALLLPVVAIARRGVPTMDA